MAKKTTTASKAEDLAKRMDVVRGILAKDEKGEYRSLADIAGKTHFAVTEKANIRKTLETLNALENEGEAENEILLDQSVWALTDIGRLRAKTTEEEFNRTLEANYIHRLIMKHMDEGKDFDEPVEEPFYVPDEEFELPCDLNVRNDENIILLSAEKKRAWGDDGVLRQAVVIPGRCAYNTLEHDIDMGAYPFKPLTEMTETDLRSKVIFIRTTKLEFGILAAEYLAIKQNAKENIEVNEIYTDPADFELENYDPSEEPSRANVLPLATLDDLLFNRPDVGFGIGEMTMTGVGNSTIRTPYFMDHCGSMIILNMTNGFYMNENMLSDAIGRVEHNKRHIFVINVEPDACFRAEEDEDYPSAGNSASLLAMVRYNASAVDIAPADEAAYYDKIFEGLSERHGLSIPSDFPRREFIQRLNKSMTDFRATFLNDLLLREATKKDSKELSMDIFRLLGHLNTGESTRLRGWDLLNSLEGMESVKQEIRALVNAMKLNKARRKRGLKCEPITAVLFAGPPGVGKSTIGQALSDILFEESLTPGRRFTVVSGSGLQAGYVGQTSARVRSLSDNADVLMVDEVYSLGQSAEHRSPYASEALAELCMLLSEASEKNDKFYIFAGYGGSSSTESINLMKTFLNSNPGIKSRIATVIDFPSYDGTQMSDIFMKQCANAGYVFDEAEVPALKSDVAAYFSERTQDPSFGNAREGKSLLAEAMRLHANIMDGRNVDDVTEEELKTITASDVRDAIASLRKMEQTRSGREARRISLIG